MNASIAESLSSLAGSVNDPRKGLPEEVFLFASSITPMVNVDLLVRNKAGHILLSWRDDPWCGTGWHVPGGVVRFQESLRDRLQKTALAELGCEVDVTDDHPEYTEFIHTDGPRERSHFITFIYHCRLPEGVSEPPLRRQPGETGCLAFFLRFPEDMIPVHTYYRKYFRS